MENAIWRGLMDVYNDEFEKKEMKKNYIGWKEYKNNVVNIWRKKMKMKKKVIFGLFYMMRKK